MKRKKIQYVRMFIQVIFFILLPGLYVNAFVGIKTIYLGIVLNNLDLTQTAVSLIEVILIFPITIFFGRFFCGWMCAFGAVSDWIYSLVGKKWKLGIRIPQKVDAKLKYIKYGILIALLATLWKMDLESLQKANPWNAFGMIFTVKKVPDISFVLTYFSTSLILLAIILFASAFVERMFCRYLCPLGAGFATVSGGRLLKIKKDRVNCGNCKACTKNCPMGIVLSEVDKVHTGECIQCMRCVEICPKKNAVLSTSNESVSAIGAGTVAALTISTMYYSVDAISRNGMNQVKAFASQIESVGGGNYVDGTYCGQGSGFCGETEVEVVVQDGSIQNIEVISSDDDKEYLDKAKSTVISEIIGSQSTKVDAVSGATFSSEGIMQAVENALGTANNIEVASGDNQLETTDSGNLTENNASATKSTTSAEKNTATTKEKSSVSSGVKTKAPTSTQKVASTQKTTETVVAKAPTKTKSPTKATVAPKKSSAPKKTSAPTKTASPVKKTATPTTKPVKTAAPTPKPTVKPTVKPTPVPTVASKYLDGTFQGTGVGFRKGTTVMSVTISNGKIVAINVVSHEDTNSYFNKAYNKVSAQMISKQSATVDTVSGATYSSKGIITAVKEALSKALR